VLPGTYRATLSVDGRDAQPVSVAAATIARSDYMMIIL
jgi:hypothetical protein